MVNLIRNGLEAMMASPRRQLTLGSRPAEDGLVEVFVADSGPGIDPQVAERLFEPFVTGKADGMGIGLAVSRNIVEAHGGRIWATPNPDGGASFHFTLRAAGGGGQ
jgi:two-component system sensor kinase FixL